MSLSTYRAGVVAHAMDRGRGTRKAAIGGVALTEWYVDSDLGQFNEAERFDAATGVMLERNSPAVEPGGRENLLRAGPSLGSSR